MATSAIDVAKDLANYNNKLERSNVDLQYAYNRSLAQEDRAWQERMANSAHQREISDLKAAGLNPVLSVTGGNGAATGSGSSTQVSKPNVDMSLPGIVMDWATAQLNSATQLQRTAMEVSGAYQRAVLETDSAWQRHITSSGDTWLGQYQNARDDLKSKFKDKYGVDSFGLPIHSFLYFLEGLSSKKGKKSSLSKSDFSNSLWKFIERLPQYKRVGALYSNSPMRVMDEYSMLARRYPEAHALSIKQLQDEKSRDRKRFRRNVRSSLKNSRTRSSFRHK